MVSVDGYFAGPNGEIDWHNVDDEFNLFAIDQLQKAAVLLFGRVTYNLMAGYWPAAAANPSTSKEDIMVAERMNNLPKIVFSKTLEKSGWNNTKVIKKIGKLEIEKLKQEQTNDIFIFGSGQIVREFTKLGLVDEFRLMVNPVILGSGKSLFKDKLNLALLTTRVFGNGNVLLYYQPK